MTREPDRRGSEMNAVTAAALRLDRGIRNLPVDLAAVAAFVLLTNVVVLAPVIRDTPLRIVVGLPFVLFVPGYAFIAALFPEAGDSPVSETDAADEDTATDPEEAVEDRGIDGVERVALSLGLSIAVVPLIGLVLNFTPWGIRLLPILLSVSAFTLVSVAVAAVRRWELPEDEQFRVPYREWTAAARSELLAPDTRADAALNVVLVASILLAMSSVGYAIVAPQQGETFSELYLLTETDDGDLVADNYPENFTRSEARELVVGVSNQEHDQQDYTLVVQLDRVSVAGNETTVERSERLQRFDMTLSHNETWHRTHSVAPTYEGENLRLTYLLYQGDPPETPTVDNAYRENHLWINVSAP